MIEQVLHAGANAASGVDESPSPSELERAVLLAVLYADVFDFAPTEDELYGRLVGCRAGRAEYERALLALEGHYLTRFEGHVVWQGREHLVPLRARRRAAARQLWGSAQRYARWLSRVPFVRMVAVSGSLAVENAEANGDVDLFCITEARRLWTARAFIVPLSKLTRLLPGRFPHYLCPNYILTTQSLEVADRNLFTAHEVVQAVPLLGADVFGRFAAANGWARHFLPQALANPERTGPLSSRRRFMGGLERLLEGRSGDLVDAALHRAFRAFYRRRALRSGWDWNALGGAYGRERYTVPEGGYVRVVRRRFAERIRTRLPGMLSDADLQHLFTGEPEDASPCYDWTALFDESYGARTPSSTSPN